MDRKEFPGPFEIKAADRGEVRAIISVFNVVDSHGHVTLPGSFPEGKEVDILWQHDRWVLPVGQGIISQDEKNAYLDGRFFIDTTKGKDAFIVVKENGQRRQWSYAYDIEKSHEGKFGEDDDREVLFFDKIDVFEASPVLVGSNTRTRTLDVKDVLEISPTMKLDDHADAVFEAVDGLVERTEGVAELRDADGRKLGAKHVERIEALIERMTAIKAGTELPPEFDATGDGLAALAAAATATARLRGVA